ncbi:MAG: hypothetical protein JO167_03915, partial [Alphaproteobacteria bacterium]|nr:hypothetical protein [Alphaproteobacteria bacterium]
QFGLLEMSRQRLRAGVIAGSTVACPHCGGQGIVRSVESTSLRVLRGLEEEAQKQRAEALTVKVASDVAIYTLNQKRRELSRLESEYSITINFEPKPELMAGAFEIDRVGHRNPEDFPRPVMAPVTEPVLDDEEVDAIAEEEMEEEDEIIAEAGAEVAPPSEDGEEQSREPRGERGDRGGRRRRRGGRNRNRRDRDDRGPREARGDQQPRGEGEQPSAESNGEAAPVSDELADTVEGGEQFVGDGQAASSTGQNGEGGRRRRRRRGRRGGHRDRFENGENGHAPQPQAQTNGEAPPPAAAPAPTAPQPPASFGSDRFGSVPDEIDTTPTDAPRVTPNAASSPSWSLSDPNEIDTTPAEKPADAAPPAPAKKGWWQRAFKS